MKLKTLYFDLGNVLVFFSLSKMFQQMGKCTGMTPVEVKHLLFETNLRELYEKGLIHTQDLYRAFQNRTTKSFTLAEFTHAFCDIFTPNTELWEWIGELKQKGLRLILLSNTSEGHFDYSSAHFPVLNLFDHKVLSYKEGVWKPDPKIFQKALEHANCAPNECFYTDDVPEFIESAKKVGLPGAVFTTTEKLKNDLKNFAIAS